MPSRAKRERVALTRVKVVLHGALRAYAREKPSVEVGLKKGQTIEEILRILGIPRKSVAFAAVNGKKAHLGHVAADGDKVAFFSPFSGG